MTYCAVLLINRDETCYNRGMDALLPILYTLGVYSAYIAGFLFLRARSIAARPPRVSLLLWLLVAIPSTLQFFFPAMLALFQRDGARFMRGDWWRLVTSLVVQDGGIAGAIANLVALALIGALAEQFWNSKQLLLLFFAGGIAGQLAGFAWQPIGAGNSVANFGLAASIAIASLVRQPPRPVLFAALLALGADSVLLVLRDIHGAAALAGAIVAVLLLRARHGERQLSV
jgi:membrane associated rhomboid family serine protease